MICIIGRLKVSGRYQLFRDFPKSLKHSQHHLKLLPLLHTTQFLHHIFLCHLLLQVHHMGIILTMSSKTFDEKSPLFAMQYKINLIERLGKWTTCSNKYIPYGEHWVNQPDTMIRESPKGLFFPFSRFHVKIKVNVEFKCGGGNISSFFFIILQFFH